MMLSIGEEITVNGERWRVLALGATNERAQTFVHLAALGGSVRQRNGDRPRQIALWLPEELIDVHHGLGRS